MRAIVLVLLLMTTAACATSANTPAQNLAMERWDACNHFNTVTLDRVDLDGRLVVSAYQPDGAPFAACVNAAADAQVRSGATSMPHMVVFVKKYGCLGGAM